jgi:hypothetical protein
MLSRSSNSELAYLYDILVASAIVVIVEGEINDRLRTGDDLPDRGEVIVVVGIGYFCLLLEISRATGREGLAGCGRPWNRRPCIEPDMFTGGRLKRAAQPSAIASEEAGGLGN